MSKSGSNKVRDKKIRNSPASMGSRPSKTTVFLLGFLLILAGAFGILYNPANSGESAEPWTVSEEGILSFSARESHPVFSVQEIEDIYDSEGKTGGFDTLKLLTFESLDTELEALLRLPAVSATRDFGNSTTDSPADGLPGIVLLPGAGISKEKEQGLARELSSFGYATLTLDQRNLAGINPESDLELFKAGLEPLEYKMVYDALKAADVLAAQPEIDSERIAVLGESNGGRFAIIASALDPSIKGVVGISTCGYGTSGLELEKARDPETYRFYRSIDPDTYLVAHPPAKFVMLHSLNDPIIGHDLALRTFEVANGPKVVYSVNETTHGYTASMKPYLEKELASIFGSL